MKKRIVLGSFLAVFLLLLVPTVPSVEYNEIKETVNDNIALNINQFNNNFNFSSHRNSSEYNKLLPSILINNFGSHDIFNFEEIEKLSYDLGVSCGILYFIYFVFLIWGDFFMDFEMQILGFILLSFAGVTVGIAGMMGCEWAEEILDPEILEKKYAEINNGLSQKNIHNLSPLFSQRYKLTKNNLINMIDEDMSCEALETLYQLLGFTAMLFVVTIILFPIGIIILDMANAVYDMAVDLDCDWV